MKFAYSTNAFSGFTLPEAITAISALGYGGVEIMADRPHAWPPDLSSREIREIRDVLARRALAVSNLNAFTLHAVGDTWNPSWIDPDPRRREIRIDHTRRCLELAEALGAPHLSTEPGGPLPPGMRREEGLRLFREGLAAVEGEARRRGVKILIEPEPGLLIETGEEFAAFFAPLDPEVFGLNLDVGHFFCVGEDPAEACRRFAAAASHVHLEDIAASREHRHLIPGTGALPLASVLDALEAEGYRGFATVELYTCHDDPLAAGAAALAHLRGLRLASETEGRHARSGG